MSLSVYQLYHKGCRHFSVGNIQSNCNKRTCLQSLSATVFSAILLCCELCQAVQMHKRYTDPLRLYRHCFDILPKLYTPVHQTKLVRRIVIHILQQQWVTLLIWSCRLHKLKQLSVIWVGVFDAEDRWNFLTNVLEEKFKAAQSVTVLVQSLRNSINLEINKT